MAAPILDYQPSPQDKLMMADEEDSSSSWKLYLYLHFLLIWIYLCAFSKLSFSLCTFPTVSHPLHCWMNHPFNGWSRTWRATRWVGNSHWVGNGNAHIQRIVFEHLLSDFYWISKYSLIGMIYHRFMTRHCRGMVIIVRGLQCRALYVGGDHHCRGVELHCKGWSSL